MEKIKVIFFGTHEFAVKILEELTQAPFIQVTGVITQPDQPVGRKQILTPPPVKLFGQKNTLPLFQPISLKNFSLSELPSYDLFVVAQYGKIIPLSIVDAPKYGTLNVHTSLLPKYRGASPIQSALIHGEKETGVTIMKMDQGMDTGPLLMQKTIVIGPDETFLQLDARLAEIGSKALVEAIPGYVEGTLVPHPQDDSQATLTKILSREDGKIDWNKTTDQIYNLYRGFTPWPGIWTVWNQKRLKLLSLKPGSMQIQAGHVEEKDNGIYIGTHNGSIQVLELQLEGKNAITASAFINGQKDFVGSQLQY